MSMDEVISPATIKLVAFEGMPIPDEDPLSTLKKTSKKGNLYVKFEIVFPKFIPEREKEQLAEILNKEEEE